MHQSSYNPILKPNEPNKPVCRLQGSLTKSDADIGGDGERVSAEAAWLQTELFSSEAAGGEAWVDAGTISFGVGGSASTVSFTGWEKLKSTRKKRSVKACVVDFFFFTFAAIHFYDLYILKVKFTLRLVVPLPVEWQEQVYRQASWSQVCCWPPARCL